MQAQAAEHPQARSRNMAADMAVDVARAHAQALSRDMVADGARALE